jgi:IS1 family transposase
MANKLPLQARVQILSLLCEGSSMRSIARVCDVSLNTVSKLLEDAGETCLDLHDTLVRNVKSKRVEADEIWSFIHTKEGNKAKAKTANPEAGDVWTWTAIDSDSKLILTYLAGQRSATSGEAFVTDLASRLADRIQLDTDGFGVYAPTVGRIFRGKVDHAVIAKIYSHRKTEGQNRYAPLECVGVKKYAATGKPDLAVASTSYVERANLTMRMGMRRFTRLTNAHSKKYANHLYALSLYFMFYNFARIHKTLRVTPAMQAGISDHVWSMEEIVAEIDRRAPKPGPRGPYKKKAAQTG